MPPAPDCSRSHHPSPPPRAQPPPSTASCSWPSPSFPAISTPFFPHSGNPSDMFLSKENQGETNIGECEQQSSDQASLPKQQRFGGNFPQVQHGQSTNPIFPSDALCLLGFHLSLLAGALAQQELFCSNSRRALLLLMLQCQDKPESETQTRFSCLERGGNYLFFPHHSEKSKAHKGLYVSRRARRQSTAQRAALNRPDSHWKRLWCRDIPKYPH